MEPRDLSASRSRAPGGRDALLKAGGNRALSETFVTESQAFGSDGGGGMAHC